MSFFEDYYDNLDKLCMKEDNLDIHTKQNKELLSSDTSTSSSFKESYLNNTLQCESANNDINNTNNIDLLNENCIIDSNQRNLLGKKQINNVSSFLKLLYKSSKRNKEEIIAEKEDLSFITNYKSSRSLFFKDYDIRNNGIYYLKNLVIAFGNHNKSDFSNKSKDNEDFTFKALLSKTDYKEDKCLISNINLDLKEHNDNDYECKNNIRYCNKTFKINNTHICCSVCLHQLDLNSKDLCSIIKCNHQFHKHCLLEWLKYNKICPIDKRKIE